MIRKMKLLKFSISSGLVIMFGTVSFSQDVRTSASINDTVQLEDVFVTAQKREELSQKIPVSLSVLSARKVQDLRLWNSNELTAVVPGLFANNSGDERNVISIRGITTTSYDPAVAVYVDGVNQFSLDTYIPQLADVERIEVLRGPQGTLYGRNAMGGVINIITKQPGNTPNGFAELSIGNNGLQRYAAGIRTPIIKDKLYFGASGVYNKRDGYYTNTFNNTSFDRQSALTGNYFLKYIPIENWGITLNLKHQNNRNNGAFPMVNGLEEAFGNPYKLNQNAVGKMMDNTLNASLTVNHSSPRYFDFISQTAWQSNQRIYDSPIDGDFSPLDAVTIINDYGNKWNKVKVFTQEFRFSTPSKSFSPVKWVGGAYLFHQSNPVKQATHFGKDAEMIGAPMTDFATINTTTATNKGYALFGQISYDINTRFSIIGGLRFDHESKDLEVRGEFQPDGEEAMITQPDTSASASFKAFSPKLGIQYSISDDNIVFANYSRGFRTGGLTQLSSDPSQPPLYPYKPEYSNSFELGTKNMFFNDRLRLNLTAFYAKITDAQVPTLVLPDAITITRNTGELVSKGFELEMNARPTNGFEIDYSFGYTHARYESLKLSQYGNETDLEGKRQVFTPDITSMLALQYGIPLTANKEWQLTLRGEWIYLGQQYFDLANQIRQSPYQKLNARVGVSGKHLGLFLWARNLTDRKFIAYAYDFGAIHLGEPEIYGVTVSAKF